MFYIAPCKSIFDHNSLNIKLSIFEFLIRISKYTEIEPNILLVSMMYIDKFCSLNSNFFINSNNCHK